MDKDIDRTKTQISYDRIALFGGSFDPVHCAHLKVARCALAQADLSRIIFLPAAQSPLKQKPFSDESARLEMLRIALQKEDKFALSTYETEQGGVSYTIDTVDYFMKLYGGAELFWIIGMDQFNQLDQWHRVDELVKKVTFLIYPRNDGQKEVEAFVAGLRYRLLNAEKMFISSTEVRERCKKGLSLAGWVPSAVEAFICRRGLYGKSLKNL